MSYTDSTFDRNRFDAVWRRVMDASDEHGPASKNQTGTAGSVDYEKLRRFMDDEACDAQLYTALAARCVNARRTLLCIAADEKRHLRKLKARYFILTGETYDPPGTCPLIRSVSDALRLKYAGEREGAEAYREAAGDTADPELRDTYLALSQDEARHSKTIEHLIENMF